jgi:hypothetical protein
MSLTAVNLKCLRPFEHWGRGFESHSRYKYLRLFCVRGVLCGWRPFDGLVTRPVSSTECLLDIRINYEWA